MRPNVAALVPAYNEGKNIREVITRLRSSLPNSSIIVIDDGSSDSTAEIAKSIGAIILDHETNKGKGEALKTGFEYIKKTNADFVVVIDSDLQFHPEEASKVLNPLMEGKADFVMGSRDWSKVPFRHSLGNLVWRILFNILFGTKLTDTNSGFIALNKKAVGILENAGGGYIIENSMLIQLIKNNMRIINVPIAVEYKRKAPVARGTRIVLGILLFILKEGIKYRLKL